MTNPIAIELKAMADRLRELFPECRHVELKTLAGKKFGPCVDLIFFCDSCTSGTELLRRIGVGERTKRVHDGSAEQVGPWSTLSGDTDGINFTAYCEGLPSSCRIETKTVRIPKTQTVDTGEFIEVQERVVKCGQAVTV